jgi:hypothetical protein
VAGVREGLRHPLVAEFVHEDERAMHPSHEEGVERSGQDSKADEHSGRRRGRTPSGREAFARLGADQRRIDSSVHERSVTQLPAGWRAILDACRPRPPG